ncbi:MAG: hypothetical protein KF883_06735 [Thermomicrobiales bacterium]|nr:hypothetical protein [Thermomicrobiales bacterium]
MIEHDDDTTGNAGSESPAEGSRRWYQRRSGKIAVTLAGALAVLGSLAFVGLRVPAKPFPAADIVPATPATIPLPPNLPPPVSRFYRTLYGEEIPVIEGVVISGTGTMRISGITLPVRFRFVHEPGHAYRHEIEVTWFRLPVMQVNEHYINGSALLQLPFGTSEGPNIDQAANLTLWAEAVWMPSIWLTDDRVHWEEVDEQSARLIVPFGEGEQEILVHFDPNHNLITHMESQRYQGENDRETSLWINTIDSWGIIDGWLLPEKTSVSWDTDEPWAILTTERIVYTEHGAAMGQA